MLYPMSGAVFRRFLERDDFRSLSFVLKTELMNQGKYIFSQITPLFPRRVFDRIVDKHNGNKWVKHFTCWNQLLCMVFGQLTTRESLRDLLVTIEAHSLKTYHLGFGKSVSRSNLAKANEKRSYQIFEDFAIHMISIARKNATVNEDFKLDIESNVYAFDSSVIDLCMSVFWWAEFRRNKAGIKLHALYDIKTSIPAYILISNAAVHDVRGLDAINYEPGAYYVLDKAYVDFGRLNFIDYSKAYFITRAKRPLLLKRIYSQSSNRKNGVLSDQTVRLTGVGTSKKYPAKLRRIRFKDEESGRTFTFLTNNFSMEAENIALLYKYRWSVELFFKWIKQHLKVKSFWGTTANAVKIQIYSAIIGYCLVAMVKESLKSNMSIYEILQVLNVSLLDKTPVNEVLKKRGHSSEQHTDYKQLSINII